MRAAEPPVSYLVGTPKWRLTKLEQALIGLPWQAVRDGVDVKLLAQEQELYVFAQSHARIAKERAMRRRQLKWLWARLKQLQAMKLTREALLMKLGAARAKARAAWRLVDVEVAPRGSSFSYTFNRKKLRQARRREGRYLLRTNLCGRQPAELWQFYIQLTQIEAAFKHLKDDLRLRPIYHQLESRIEAHIFVAFMAYCLHVTLRARLMPLAGGLTPRAVLDKFADIQMLDVRFPTTDGRTLTPRRLAALLRQGHSTVTWSKCGGRCAGQLDTDDAGTRRIDHGDTWQQDWDGAAPVRLTGRQAVPRPLDERSWRPGPASHTTWMERYVSVVSDQVDTKGPPLRTDFCTE